MNHVHCSTFCIVLSCHGVLLYLAAYSRAVRNAAYPDKISVLKCFSKGFLNHFLYLFPRSTPTSLNSIDVLTFTLLDHIQDANMLYLVEYEFCFFFFFSMVIFVLFKVSAETFCNQLHVK